MQVLGGNNKKGDRDKLVGVQQKKKHYEDNAIFTFAIFSE